MTEFNSLASRCTIRPAQDSDAEEIYRWLTSQGSRKTLRSLLNIALGFPVGIIIAKWLAWSLSGAVTIIEPTQLLLISLHIVLSSLIGAFVGVLIPRILTKYMFFKRRSWINFWLVECNGHLSGYAHLTYKSNYSILQMVYMDIAYRDQGIGSYLVEYLTQTVTKPFYVACAPELLRFYTRLGFLPVSKSEIPHELRFASTFKLLVLCYESQANQLI